MSKRRLVVVGCAGDAPLYGFDSRSRDERDDDDGPELRAALDEARSALDGLRDGSLDATRAGFALQHAGLALERHGRRGAADVVARADETGEGGRASRGGELDATWPPGRVRGRDTDHRDDFAPIEAGGNADDQAPEWLRDVLLPPPPVKITHTADMALDAAERRRNQQLSREIAERVYRRQQRPDFDELVGLGR